MRVELGIGTGFDKNGKLIPNLEGKLGDIVKRASEIFGGAALIPVSGGWVNGAGQYVRESGVILRIDNIATEKLPLAEEFAFDVKAVLNQTSVVFSVSSVNTRFL